MTIKKRNTIIIVIVAVLVLLGGGGGLLWWLLSDPLTERGQIVARFNATKFMPMLEDVLPEQGGVTSSGMSANPLNRNKSLLAETFANNDDIVGRNEFRPGSEDRFSLYNNFSSRFNGIEDNIDFIKNRQLKDAENRIAKEMGVWGREEKSYTKKNYLSQVDNHYNWYDYDGDYNVSRTTWQKFENTEDAEIIYSVFKQNVEIKDENHYKEFIINRQEPYINVERYEWLKINTDGSNELYSYDKITFFEWEMLTVTYSYFIPGEYYIYYTYDGQNMQYTEFIDNGTSRYGATFQTFTYPGYGAQPNKNLITAEIFEGNSDEYYVYRFDNWDNSGDNYNEMSVTAVKNNVEYLLDYNIDTGVIKYIVDALALDKFDGFSKDYQDVMIDGVWTSSIYSRPPIPYEFRISSWYYSSGGITDEGTNVQCSVLDFQVFLDLGLTKLTYEDFEYHLNNVGDAFDNFKVFDLEVKAENIAGLLDALINMMEELAEVFDFDAA